MKKVFIAASVITALVSAGFYVYKSNPRFRRYLASVDENGPAQDLLINQVNLSWQTTDQGINFEITDGSEDMCSRWTNLKIVFKAEGIAYSGEVDRVIQTSFCDGNSFRQTWVPNLTQAQNANLEKIGLFQEEPPEWVLDYISINGVKGAEVMTAEEIEQYYGNIPAMYP